MKIESDRIIARTDWLSFVERSFRDRNGGEKRWTFVERRNRRAAVIVIARTIESHDLIVVRQERIPIGDYVYEFPAGLVDDGEESAETAVRELAEETGYRGEASRVSPVLYSSPGLTNEAIYAVEVITEETPTARLGRSASEVIEVVRIENGSIDSFLKQTADRSLNVDAKLYAYLLAKTP